MDDSRENKTWHRGFYFCFETKEVCMNWMETAGRFAPIMKGVLFFYKGPENKGGKIRKLVQAWVMYRVWVSVTAHIEEIMDGASFCFVLWPKRKTAALLFNALPVALQYSSQGEGCSRKSHWPIKCACGGSTTPKISY